MAGMNGRLRLDHHLPEDLLREILLRLPVKSLIRFKCVCKYWYALIQNPNFVSDHYHHPNNCSHIIVRHLIETPDLPRDLESNTAYPIQSTEYAFSLFFNETLTGGGFDGIVSVTESNSYTITGPIDGLFLLHTYHRHTHHRIAIWNPATTEFKHLPNPNLGLEFPPSKYVGTYVFGFGLDPLTNDYKVVWLSDRQIKVAALYTLGSDSWRRIDGPVNLVMPGSNWFIIGGHFCKSDATYLNGRYYWLSMDPKSDATYFKLLLFDMVSDVFGEMSTPPYCNNNNNNSDPSSLTRSPIRYHLTLALHGDNIALLITEQHDVDFHPTPVYEHLSSISVCVMKNQREEEGSNWTNLYTLQLTSPPLQQLQRPLGLWINNGIFFQNDTTGLVLYNNNTHEIIDLGVRAYDSGSYFSIMVFNFKESLVSFGGEKKDQSHVMVRDFFA